MQVCRVPSDPRTGPRQNQRENASVLPFCGLETNSVLWKHCVYPAGVDIFIRVHVWGGVYIGVLRGGRTSRTHCGLHDAGTIPLQPCVGPAPTTPTACQHPASTHLRGTSRRLF